MRYISTCILTYVRMFSNYLIDISPIVCIFSHRIWIITLLNDHLPFCYDVVGIVAVVVVVIVILHEYLTKKKKTKTMHHFIDRFTITTSTSAAPTIESVVLTDWWKLRKRNVCRRDSVANACYFCDRNESLQYDLVQRLDFFILHLLFIYLFIHLQHFALTNVKGNKNINVIFPCYGYCSS